MSYDWSILMILHLSVIIAHSGQVDMHGGSYLAVEAATITWEKCPLSAAAREKEDENSSLRETVKDKNLVERQNSEMKGRHSISISLSDYGSRERMKGLFPYVFFAISLSFLHFVFFLLCHSTVLWMNTMLFQSQVPAHAVAKREEPIVLVILPPGQQLKGSFVSLYCHFFLSLIYWKSKNIFCCPKLNCIIQVL